jgi:outer membrane lipoprotein-sorting protein
MKPLLGALAILAALMPVRGSAGDDLLARMSDVNRNLHSYVATMKAHVTMTTFPFVQTDLSGTYYHKDPDLNKLEITGGLPGMAGQFSKLYPRIEPPSAWSALFDVTKVSDDGSNTHFKLVPKKQGDVVSIDAVVDDKRATITSMTWSYANGGTAEMSNTYGNVKGYILITSQTGRVDEPEYKGTIDSTMSDYKLNPAIPDSVFTEGQ